MIVRPAAPPAPPQLTAVAGAHSRVSPSSLHRIRICAASLQMQEAFPHLPWEDDESSAEGQCAHWVLQQALTLGARYPEEGDLDPAGTPVTDEMLDGVELAVDAVGALLAKHGATRADLVIEQTLAVTRIHATCWGTPDIRFWSPRTGTLVVIDFKFGFRYVEEFENDQLVAYTVGEMDTQGVIDTSTPCSNVIIQPRAYGRSPVREWNFMGSDIRGFVNVMTNAVAAALAPNPTAVATPDGCRNCRARNGCPTNMAAGQIAMAYSSTPQPLDLPPVALSNELRFAEHQLELLQARVTGLEAQAKYLIEQGQRLPHHVLKASAGRTVWTLPDDQIVAMGPALGLDLAKKAKPITVKQAVDAGLNRALLPALSTTRAGAMKLVADDGSSSRRIFGGSQP